MSTLKVNNVQSFNNAATDYVVINRVAVRNVTASHVSNNLQVSGNLFLNGNLNPENSSSSATHDLGSMIAPWRNAHIHGLGHIHTASINVVSGNLLPDTGGTYALGTMDKSWGSLHVHGLAHIHTASINVVSGNLIPVAPTFTVGSPALGTMDHAWGSLHVHGLAHIHTASISSVSGNLIPNADDSFDLGSSGREWRNLHLDGTANVDVLNVEGLATFLGDLRGTTISGSRLRVQNSTTTGVDLASATPSKNGGKVTVQAITAAQINDGAFAQFNLLNTSLEEDSVIVCSFNGKTAGNITGSILRADVLKSATNTYTASVSIFNESGTAIAADTGFTASFVIL